MARQSYDGVMLLYPIDGDTLSMKCRCMHLVKSLHIAASQQSLPLSPSWGGCVSVSLCLCRLKGEIRYRGKRFEEFEYFFERGR